MKLGGLRVFIFSSARDNRNSHFPGNCLKRLKTSPKILNKPGKQYSLSARMSFSAPITDKVTGKRMIICSVFIYLVYFLITISLENREKIENTLLLSLSSI